MKKFINNKFRIVTLIFIGVAFIISMVISDEIERIKSIEKVPINVLVDEEFEEGFNEIVNFAHISWYYEILYSKEHENSNIILTSDINNIDKKKDYTILGNTPLVCIMKKSENLNNYLTQNCENGFLISEYTIKNKSSDAIYCDFLKLFEAIISGKDWSFLGGENKEIKLYCPEKNTLDGKLFEEFLFKSLKNNSKSSDEEIRAKIQEFFEKDNVIQTDVVYKLKLLDETVSEYDIFITFENEILKLYQTNSHNDLNFIYPQTTILKNVFFQYNSEKEDLKQRLIKEDYWSSDNDIIHKFYIDDYYRLGETGQIRSLEYSCNVQEKIDTF